MTPPRPPTETNLPSNYYAGFCTVLLHVLPSSFPDALTVVLEMTLEQTPFEDQTLLELIASFGLIRNFETLICRVCYRAIERRITQTCAEKWDTPCLKEMQVWVQKTLAPWAAHIFSFSRPSHSNDAYNAKSFDIDPGPQRNVLYGIDRNITQKFEFHVCKTLFELR